MSLVPIPPDHPYLAQLRPYVGQYPDGTWKVRWRCFHALKWDQQFATEAEARYFARSLMLGPHHVDISCISFEESDVFWRESAPRRATK